jgi:hypothetical protein
MLIGVLPRPTTWPQIFWNKIELLEAFPKDSISQALGLFIGKMLPEVRIKGRYGIIETILFLTGPVLLKFCRLFIELYSIFTCGPTYSLWSFLIDVEVFVGMHVIRVCLRRRGHMILGRAIFHQGGWPHINRLQDAYADFVFPVLMVDSCRNFHPWFFCIDNEIFFELYNKKLCVSFECRGRVYLISNKW